MGVATSLKASRLVLVTGGARSGKSQFALTLSSNDSHRRYLYLATGVACDPEMRRRIARHVRGRSSAWKTLEEPLRLAERLSPKQLSPGTFLIVECLSTWVTNLLMAERSALQIRNSFERLIFALRRRGVTAVLVTNEVGCGIVPEHPLGRQFRDLLGEINQKAASLSDEVYLLVSGLPVRLK